MVTRSARAFRTSRERGPYVSFPQRLFRRAIAYAVFLGLSAGSVAAQGSVSGDEWSSSVALYLHASDLNGTVTRGAVELPVDISFSTLLDKLNTAFTIHGETQRGAFGVGVDYFYFGLGDTAIATPLENVTIEEVNLNIKNFELFGIGRVGDPTRGRGAFDLLAGARYRGLSSDLSFGLPIIGTVGPLSGDRSWWDMLLGGRYLKALHPRVSVRLRADTGTDVFNVQGGVDLRVAEWLLLGIQYKYVNFDHSEGQGLNGFTYDVTEHGPLFGAAFVF